MKLLILTQKVDDADPILGFFVEWIREFAVRCESVSVICLEKGLYKLPENVEVFSLGKEEGKGRLTYVYRFYTYLWGMRHTYQSVFVHMNPIYVTLGGALWRLLSKKIGLWYVHQSVDLKLRIAEMFTDHIFTASKESFRLQSKKVHVVGHAINTTVFTPYQDHTMRGIPVLLTTGRLSPTKNVHLLLEAVTLLKERGVLFTLQIIGNAGTPEQSIYEERLKKYVAEGGLSEQVLFLGAQPHSEIPQYLKNTDLYINLSDTGSLDKAVLEAMASGVPTITSNEAFKDLLGEYSDMLYVKKDPNIVAGAIEKILNTDTVRMRTFLRGVVEREHSFTNTINTIVKILS